MIVGKGKGENFARLKRDVGRAFHLAFSQAWFHAETRDAKYGNFGIVDDGRKSRPADAAQIRNREDPAGHFLEAKLFLPRSLGKLARLFRKLRDAFLIHVADDGNNQAIARIDGNSDIEIVLVDDLPVGHIDAGGELWKFV